MDEREKAILDKYLTSGLRRNTLSRTAKKEQLAAGYKITGEEAEKILNKLYGPAPESPPLASDMPKQQ